jgi:hypothetical protein
MRDHLLDEWVDAGGGTSSFFAAEADAFLDFLAQRLPADSHTNTICRLEQATLRASEGARQFVIPDARRLDGERSVIRTGPFASLVRFLAEPRLLIRALNGDGPPPVGSATIFMLFAPGLKGWCRMASAPETALWQCASATLRVSDLLAQGHRRETVAELTLAGALEIKEAVQ